MSFEAISQYVGAHDAFSKSDQSIQLYLYALYKSRQAHAPAYSFPYRLFLFAFHPSDYKKWLTWWVVSDRYGSTEAEARYYEVARELGAFPSDEHLRIMAASGQSAGKGASRLVEVEPSVSGSSKLDELIEACGNNDVECLRTYLEADGDANLQTEEGTTLLHFAVDHEVLEIVQVLIDHGANVSRPDDQGLTPLDAAIMNGFEDIATLLKGQGGKSS